MKTTTQHIKKVKPAKKASSTLTGLACIPSGNPDIAN